MNRYSFQSLCLHVHFHPINCCTTHSNHSCCRTCFSSPVSSSCHNDAHLTHWLLLLQLLHALKSTGLDLVGPDLVFGALTSLYVVAGIISLNEGASGFSNTGVLTVLVLYLVAEGVSQTGGALVVLTPTAEPWRSIQIADALPAVCDVASIEHQTTTFYVCQTLPVGPWARHGLRQLTGRHMLNQASVASTYHVRIHQLVPNSVSL